MSKKTITQRIVQYFEDPKESNALAEIKRLSEQAKNKSSKNLIRIDTTIDRPDINTEINTKLNRKMFKENNNKKFQRRKYQFPTQIFQPSIVNDLKRKANLKNWHLFDDNDEEEEKNDIVTKKIKNKNAEKHVNFSVNQKNKKEPKRENPRKYTFNANQPKIENEINNPRLNNPRKISSDDSSLITHRIVKYLDDPKDSEALAKIKKLSNQAKNKTSKNLVHINPYDIDIKQDSKTTKKSSDTFQRRKFQFPTQVYKPKRDNFTLFQELKLYKNKKDDGIKNKKINNIKNNDSDAIGSEDDEDDDSDFNLEKNDNTNEIKNENIKYSNKTYDTAKEITQKENTNINSNNNTNFSRYKNELKSVKKEIEVKETKEEKKEEQKPEMPVNTIKYRKITIEKNKEEPMREKEREKYSSSTFNVDDHIKNINRRKDFIPRRSYKFDPITEEYKKRNNLTVEKINTKEKIIKNEYGNKNNEKRKLKSYRTEYFWDKTINRLVEKRIYLDENDPSKSVGINNGNKTYYSNNTFNPFNKYKRDFENKEKENNENNVTQEKIDIDNENIDNKRQKGKYEFDNKNTVKENSDKKFVYSRKYKYMPHQYNTNTFQATRNVPNNINKEPVYQNETSKPNYKIYQKRQIITTKVEIKENNHKKNGTDILVNEESNDFNKRASKKETEIRKKVIFSKKILQEQTPTPNPVLKPKNIQKKVEVTYKKISQPYSSNTTNTKNRSIRLNILSGEKNIFEENENDLNNRNKNSIYSNYIKNRNGAKNNLRQNRTKNTSELVEDLEKIEQYSVNTYLKNDLLEIYGSINEEFKKFKNDVFNNNMSNFEEKLGEFDNKNSIRKRYKYNVKDLCKGKTTTDDIFRKYTKRAINIENEKESYNKK